MSTSARRSPGLPGPRRRRRRTDDMAEPGEPGLPLCHRSRRAGREVRRPSVGERSGPAQRGRPVSRGVCPRRFGGL